MTEVAKKFMNMSIWIAIVIFMLRCCISWGEVKAAVDAKEIFKCGYTLFGFVGEAIGITAIIMACFNKWLWKYKPFKWLHDVPILAEKYEGKIRFKNAENIEEERNTTIRIEQTFLNISVKLGTEESSSNSVMAIIKEINGSQMLMYTYLNTPRAEIQDRSSIHYGTAMLNADNPEHLVGNYFTIRQSRGSMNLKAIVER